jgi:hypothetical protein
MKIFPVISYNLSNCAQLLITHGLENNGVLFLEVADVCAVPLIFIGDDVIVVFELVQLFFPDLVDIYIIFPFSLGERVPLCLNRGFGGPVADCSSCFPLCEPLKPKPLEGSHDARRSMKIGLTDAQFEIFFVLLVAVTFTLPRHNY